MTQTTTPAALRFEVPYEMLITDNQRLQPVLRKNGIPSVTLSSAYKAKKEAIATLVRGKWKGGRYGGPLRVEFRLWAPPRSRTDCSNLFKVALDAMEGIVVKNDRQFTEVSIREESRSERDNPRLEAVVAPPTSEVWTA